MTRKAVDSASAVALITMPTYTKSNFIIGGRAVERLWLEATKNNLTIHPLLAALFLFTRVNHGKGINMSQKMIMEVKNKRETFKKIFNINDSMGEIFLFKIAPSSELKVKSLRKPVETVLTIKK